MFIYFNKLGLLYLSKLIAPPNYVKAVRLDRSLRTGKSGEQCDFQHLTTRFIRCNQHNIKIVGGYTFLLF